MNEETIGLCWNCQRPLTGIDYGREDNCLGCGKATRACRNCLHYAPGRPDDCAESLAEAVLDKVRANFCSFFEPAKVAATEQRSPDPADLIKAAADLFK